MKETPLLHTDPQDVYLETVLFRRYKLHPGVARDPRPKPPVVMTPGRMNQPTGKRQERLKVAALEISVPRLRFYCRSCQQVSVFAPPNHGLPDDRTTVGPYRVVDRRFSCSMDPAHPQAIFVFRIRDDVLIKIGQFPSPYEIADYEIRRFRARFAEDEKELRRAIGLNSHGVGVGAFVYLRRILERQLQAAQTRLVSSGATSQADWDGTRLAERLALARTHDPDFADFTPTLYSVLSRGIHELDEDSCAHMFSLLRKSIEHVLDLQLERLARAARTQDLENEIQRAKADLDSDS